MRPVPIARRRRVSVNTRAMLAIAAVLLLALAGAKVLPGAGLASLGRAATSLSPLRLTGPSGSPHVTAYALDARYSIASSAMATGAWLVYSATDTTRGSMLFAESRSTKQASPLLAAPSAMPITVRGLSDRWAIWTAGSGAASGAWTLRASALMSGSAPAAGPQTLVDSASTADGTPATLGGVWMSGDTVLVAGAAASGSGVLLRYDLSSGAPATRTVLHTAPPGHLLTDPSTDGSSIYWADVWHDDDGLHGTIWRLDAAGRTEQVSGGDTEFHPAASNGTLVWVDVSPSTVDRLAPDGDSAQADADKELVNQLNGGLQARDLASGRQWQISARADVSSVQRGGSMLLWHSDSQTHLYDLRTKAPAAVDLQVRSATLAAATGSAVVWEPATAAPLAVYDMP